MAMMFSGVFVCFLSVLFGPRRILLPAAAIFTVTSALLPFAPNYWGMLALVVIAGLASGTFYSLTMTFVLTALPKRLIIFGIAAYAADIVFVSNIASDSRGLVHRASILALDLLDCRDLHAVDDDLHLFRNSAAASRGSRGRVGVDSLISASASALLYGALDQGERLDWLNSGVIVAMLAGGVFLLAAALVRRMLQPNPTLNLSFLNRRNTIILALSIFVFKFTHLATIVLIPGFLGNIQQYRPLQTGHALAWVAVPMFAVVWLVACAGDSYELATDSDAWGSPSPRWLAGSVRTSTPPGREPASRRVELAAGGRVRVHVRRPGEQHRFGGARSGRLDQRQPMPPRSPGSCTSSVFSAARSA